MGNFLEPGEEFKLDVSCGQLSCRALSFRQQRQLIKIIKEMQTNNDPLHAMDLVEDAIKVGVHGWDKPEPYTIDALLDSITSQEAIDVVKRVTEAGKLSEADQKK